jgi:AraC family transcriptional regulator, arabinose operon regulatory protein
MPATSPPQQGTGCVALAERERRSSSCASAAQAVDADTYAVSAGTGIVIAAGSRHEYQASETTPWTIWWLHMRGTEVSDLTSALLGSAPQVLQPRSLDRVVALFDELVTMLERRLSPTQLLAASGAATHLLTRLAADSVLPADGSALERAMRYLEARVDGNIQVAELAAIVQMSASHLSALFREATGGGPGAFHTSLKMARARALLDTTTSTVTEIASAVGYSDPLYFSRHFRRVHGMSPSAYRAEHKA